MVSTGSERLFHMAADQPFAQTHDHGLKRKLQADTPGLESPGETDELTSGH